jgi:hypothetical protein
MNFLARIRLLESVQIFRKPNMEFSCRPEAELPSPLLWTAFLLCRLHPGEQLQRFVIHTHFFIPL